MGNWFQHGHSLVITRLSFLAGLGLEFAHYSSQLEQGLCVQFRRLERLVSFSWHCPGVGQKGPRTIRQGNVPVSLILLSSVGPYYLDGLTRQGMVRMDDLDVVVVAVLSKCSLSGALRSG